MTILETEQICLGLRVFAVCDRCASKVPVNRLGRSVRCPECQNTQPLSLEFWHEGWEMKPISKVVVRGKTWDDDGKRRWIRVRRRLPSCSACHEELTDELLRTAEPGALKCPGCGVDIACRAANEYALKLVGGAALLIGEAPTSEDNPDPPAASAPLVYTCMQCGGVLTVDGSSRRVRCGYCESDNFLPEDLWRELRPKSVVREIFLVARPNLYIRWMFLLFADPKGVRPLVAKAPSLPPKFFDFCVRHGDQKLGLALATRADLNEKQQLKLIKSSKAVAREIAQRPNLTPKVLAALRDRKL